MKPERDIDPKTDGPEALSDDRLLSFAERRLSPAERAALLRELEGEPEKIRELEALERVVEVLHRVPVAEAPPNFLRDVQGRIRRRSRGRYFGLSTSGRLPYEALLNGLLIFVMLVLYMVGIPTEDRRVLVPIPAATFEARGSDVGTIAAVLSQFGPVSRADGDGVTHFELTVPASRLEALKAELSLYPVATLERSVQTEEGVRVRVRVDGR